MTRPCDTTDTRFPLCNTFSVPRSSIDQGEVTCGHCLRLLNPAVTPRLSTAGLAWLREYLRDTYNDDFMSDYQLELVGVVPADVRVWADIEPLSAADLRVVR